MSLSEKNKELKIISIAELKEFERFSTISDEDAVQIIESLKQLALITHNIITLNEQPNAISELRKAE